MKNKFIILFVLLLQMTVVFAQHYVEPQEEDSIRYLKNYGKIDLSFSGLGLSFEIPIADRVLLEIAAGVGAGYRVNENFRYRLYFNDPAAYASAHVKYYYNQQRRVDRGRPVSFNAGNFFGVKAKYASPTLDKHQTWHTLLAAFHWGMQRKMGRHFMYQLTIGIGGAIDLEDKTSTHVTLYPDANFRVSYVLPFF